MQRSLIYHITPLGCWQWNLEQLKPFIEIFNGPKVCAVAYGDGLPEVKKRDMLNYGFDFVEYEANDEDVRESASFPKLVGLVVGNSGATFYGHTKGVTRGDDPAVQLWTKWSYEKNLSNMSAVESQLDQYCCTGSFKRYGKFNCFPPGSNNWHYSGSFFWFNNRDVRSRPWESKFKMHRYGVESFLSFLFEGKDAGCLFADRCGNPYNMRYLMSLRDGR